MLVVGYKLDVSGEMVGLFINDTWQNHSNFYEISKLNVFNCTYEDEETGQLKSWTYYNVIQITTNNNTRIQILSLDANAIIVPESITISGRY